MAVDLLDEVRISCDAVVRGAAHVRIDQNRLPGYAAALVARHGTEPDGPPPSFPRGEPGQVAAWVVTLAAVNFGSGWFPELVKIPGCSGSITVTTRLAQRFEAAGPLTAEELATIDTARCGELLGQPRDGAPGELMGLFARSWNELGAWLLEHHHGSFLDLLDRAGSSAPELVARLAGLPLFADVATHQGRPVAFYKRAQLAAADLARGLRGHPIGQLRELHRLTAFADNLVPHVLRLDGVLCVDGGLVDRIEAGELIEAGSQPEVELRAGVVTAVEALVATLRAAGHEVDARTVDNWLWSDGQQPRYKAQPRHRTRTVWY